MSKCAVHMMKMKSSAMGGIQSHNQREHESTKNKDMDYEKSDRNFDLVNDESINYQRAIKERIAELNLKKPSVRTLLHTVLLSFHRTEGSLSSWHGRNTLKEKTIQEKV